VVSRLAWKTTKRYVICVIGVNPLLTYLAKGLKRENKMKVIKAVELSNVFDLLESRGEAFSKASRGLIELALKAKAGYFVSSTEADKALDYWDKHRPTKHERSKY
jgi:hypothetical protein